MGTGAILSVLPQACVSIVPLNNPLLLRGPVHRYGL